MPPDPVFLPLENVFYKNSPTNSSKKRCICKYSLQQCPTAIKMDKSEQHANMWDKCPKYIKLKKASKICIYVLYTNIISIFVGKNDRNIHKNLNRVKLRGTFLT